MLLGLFYPVECLTEEIITSVLKTNNACVMSRYKYDGTKVEVRHANLHKNVRQ